MAKLPDNFVKAPAETSRVTAARPAGKEVRRKARRGAAQPPADAPAPGGRGEPGAHDVLVRLSPDEHHALSAACAALAAVGEAVTIEDMIRRVVERWIAATRAATAPEVPAQAPGEVPARAIDTIRGQLRWIAEQPVRRWRALRAVVRRWSHALAG